MKFKNLSALKTFAQEFAQKLRPGDKVSLEGPIGSGKTTFVQALYVALNPGANYLVTSPTFTLLQEYPLKNGSLIHMDLYRMNSYQDFIESDLLAACDKNDILCIEWGDRFPELGDLWTYRLNFKR